MFIIDFNSSARKAFLHGLLKGMAAPVVLFHRETAPAVVQPPYVPMPDRTDVQVLVNDWLRIGLDAHNVVTANEPKPKKKVSESARQR